MTALVASNSMKNILKSIPASAALCVGLLLCAFFVAPAHAASNVGSGLIGNTVVLTGPAGTTQIFYVDRDNLIILMPDGKKRRGWWRVKGKSICTRTSDAPENCTAPVDVPPVVGASGLIDGGNASINWEVKAGRAF
jgi:hypothetical protein